MVHHPTRGAIPFETRDYQTRILEDWEEPNRVIVKSRQIGITQTLAIEAYVKTAVNGRPLALCVSRNEDQAKEFIRYVRQVAKPGELRTDNTRELCFANGSRIVAQPASVDAGRGYPASDVYLDEFAFPLWAQQIYQSIQPTLSNGGRITVFSSPKGRANVFYQIWAGTFGGDDVWTRYDLPWSVLWDEAWAERQRAKMTREAFAEEYEAKDGFLATGGQRFEEADLRACYVPGGTFRPWEAGHRYVLTCDPAGTGKDATVLQVWDVTALPYVLVAMERWIVAPFQRAYDTAAALATAYKPYLAMVDCTGLGAPMLEEFEGRLCALGVHTQGFQFTHQSKAAMLTSLSLLVERHGLLYGDATLHSELGLYQDDDKDLMTDTVMAAGLMAAATHGATTATFTAPEAYTGPVTAGVQSW